MLTGTSALFARADYALRLAAARLITDGLYTDALQALTGDKAAAFVPCDLANATICPGLERTNSASILALYNSRGQAATDVNVILPVPVPSGSSYAVLDSKGAPVMAQLVPLSAADLHLRSSYYNYSSAAAPAASMQWLAFQAPQLPAAGYAVFFIVPAAADDAVTASTHASTIVELQPTEAAAASSRSLRSRKAATKKGKRAAHPAAATGTTTESSLPLVAGDQVIGNGVLNLTISGATGCVSTWTSAGVGAVPLTQSFAWYNSSVGVDDDVDGDGQASGAYIFR